MANAIHLTDDSFNSEVLESKLPVLIDFSTPWCGPCKVLSPIIDELSVEMAGIVKFCKIDADEHPNASIEYGVRSMPTMLIFKDGAHIDTIVGAAPKKQIIERLKANI